jgi:hypothetical protein
MRQEDKELLLKDLAARLPYKVLVNYGYNAFNVHNGHYMEHGTQCILSCYLLDVFISPRQNEKGEYIIPYLRPLSSMTEEENAIFNNISNKDRGYEEDEDGWIRCDSIHTKWGVCPDGCAKLLDYLNSIHIDYRGLIEKGLAIAVTEENNPYKT